MKITDAMVHAARASDNDDRLELYSDREISAILAAVAPLILAEAAKRAENTWDGDKPHPIGLHIAAAIRALKVQP